MAEQTEKTEKPTGKRLGEAKRKGDVAHSSEVDTAIFLLVLIIVLKIGGPYIWLLLKDMMRYSFTNFTQPITESVIQTLYIKYMFYFWLIIGPIGFLLMLTGVVSSVLQVGWIFTFDKLKWKWNILNLGGLKEIFSIEGFKKLAKGLIKLFALSMVAWMIIRKEIANMMGLIFLDVSGIFHFLYKIILKVLIYILLFYVFFAVFDFFWSKYIYIKRMKMSKSEVKDEFKQMEGDPLVKNKIRSLMMEESMKRMMAKVPEADVVITNPIHLAVALKYEPTISEAPIVVAKGKRIIAEKIKEIARENNIPIIEDKPLARLLYKHSEVGKEIDVQFYSAVAEILANVFKMKGKDKNL